MTIKLAYSVKGAAEASSLSETHIKAAIAKGLIRTRRSSLDKDGEPVGRRLILADALQAYLDSLPEG